MIMVRPAPGPSALIVRLGWGTSLEPLTCTGAWFPQYFGYTHGKEPFVFIKDSTVTANSVLVANNEDRINYPSLGRLIKSLSPELFGQSIELANAQRDAEKVAIFESAIINNVSVRDLRTQLKEQNMQDALADVKKAQKASIANLLGKQS